MFLSNLFNKLASLFKPTDYDAMLVDALNNLLADSPTVSIWWKSIVLNRGRQCMIINTVLHGDVEGTTTVSDTEDPLIKIDVFKVVAQKHDRLEPVLGHEISHVYDAYFTYGIPAFNRIVAAESYLPWEQRTVEKLAIAHEDSLRLELLRNNPKRYKGMFKTRARQNQVANSNK